MERLIRLSVAFGGGFMIFAGMMLWYNIMRYGNILETGYTAQDSGLVRYAVGPQADRLGSMIYAIYAMLLSPGKGILLYAPILIVSLIGIAAFARRHRLETVIIGLMCGALVLFHAALPGHYWYGGWSWGPRYLLAALPIAAIPAAAGFTWIASLPRGRLWASLALVTMVVMQVPSIVMLDYAYYIRADAANIGPKQLIDSVYDSPYFGTWRETARVTEELMHGSSPPRGRLTELSGAPEIVDQAELMHTYQMWWFRLLQAHRVGGIARSGVLAVVGTLLLIGGVAFLICTGLAWSGERGLRAGRLVVSGLAETRPGS
jgi:hypothetical protein